MSRKCTDAKHNPVQICSLVRLKTKTERYGFTLSFHGWYVNGWTYNRESGSISGPFCRFKGKRVALAKGRGMQVRYLRDRLERMIEGEEDES